MPYYNQYNWGDALSQIGQSLSQYAQVRDQREIDKIKFRYGDNIEAWRQEAIKNPHGEDGKWYKKYIGDPMKPLPEDPKVAQQRQMADQQDQFYRNIINDPNIPDEQKRQIQIMRNAHLAGFSPSVVEPIIRAMTTPKQAPLTRAQEVELYGKIGEMNPQSTPQSRQNVIKYVQTGETPSRISLESTPGNTSGIVGAMQKGGTAGLVGELQKSLAPSSIPEMMGELGVTKQQITEKQKAEELALKKKKFEQSQKNFDERMTQTKKNYQLALKSLNELVAYRGRTENRAEGSARRLEASAVAQKNATLLSGYRSLLVAAEREKSNALSQDDMDKAQTKIDQYNGEIMKIMAEIEAAKQQLKSGQTTPAPNPAPAPTGTPTPAPAKSSWADQMKQGAKQ